MAQQERDRIFALAGIYQSCDLVTHFAEKGIADKTAYRTALSSIFNLNPSSTLDVFGSLTAIQPGLTLLARDFATKNPQSVNLMRYSFSVIAITVKLMKNKDALDKIAARLDRIKAFYPSLSDEVLEEKEDEISYSLAGIYSDIISPLTRKIKVVGNPNYLQNNLVQAKVRTALFAAIRAAILWYQVGGSRFQLIFGRKAIINGANRLLAQTQNKEIE